MKYDRRYKEDILRLRALGYSYNEIQKELGCAKSTIAYHLGEGQKQKSHNRSQSYRDKLTMEIGVFKEKTGCMDCKRKDLVYVQLDFDHVRGQKVSGISGMIRNYSREDIFKEIEKCEIICANCHRLRTLNRSKKKINKN